MLATPTTIDPGRNGYNYVVTIIKPRGVIDTTLDWCKKELSGDWRWQLLETSNDNHPGQYIFYFDKDKDYFAFTLKWY
jgi:hypothetical protein